MTKNANEDLSHGDAAEAPVVIDLPDGQRLVLGPQKPGTTIEIATWTGSGAPDSRTERVVIAFGTTSPSRRSSGGFGRRFGRRAHVGEQSRSGVETPPVVPEPPSTASEEPTPASLVDGSQVGRTRGRRRRIVLLAGALPIVGGAILVLSPLSVVRPSGGLTTTIGATSDALVITRPATTFSPGSSVIARRSDSGKLVLGRISAREGGAILLVTDSGFVQVSASSVKGEAILVVPFLGILKFWN